MIILLSFIGNSFSALQSITFYKWYLDVTSDLALTLVQSERPKLHMSAIGLIKVKSQLFTKVGLTRSAKSEKKMFCPIQNSRNGGQILKKYILMQQLIMTSLTGSKLFENSIVFIFRTLNLLYTNGHCPCYMLDESICQFRSNGSILSLLFHF